MDVTKKTFRPTAFTKWHTKSAVRSRPYRYEVQEDDLLVVDPNMWFPAILIPALDHPQVAALPAERLLHVHLRHLVHFLDYTTELEVAHVNSAVTLMVGGELRKYFSDEDRSAILKLYVDEGYHALFSKELADQISRLFRIKRSRSLRILELRRFERSCPIQFKALGAFVIAFVSETIVVRELSMLSRAELIRPVYHMFRDHLDDEGQHAQFFMNCFVRIWEQLCEGDRDFIVDALVKVSHIFCFPDLKFNKLVFKDCFVEGVDVCDYLAVRWRERISTVLDMTLLAIRRTDLLSHAAYVKKFRSAGLLS